MGSGDEATMELRQLRYFVMLGTKLSFSRAAELLYITQPTLSQQISALERELGCRLVLRERHEVSLTPEGKAFLDEARFLVSKADELKQNMRNHVQEEAQKKEDFFAGMSPVISFNTRVMAALAKGIDSSIREKPDYQFVFRTDDGELDRLGRYGLFIAGHRNMKLEKAVGIREYKLDHCDNILAYHTCTTGKSVRQMVEEKGIAVVKTDEQALTPIIRFFEGQQMEPKLMMMPDMETEVLQACSGMAVAFVPRSVAGKLFYGNDVEFYSLPNVDEEEVCTYAYWDKNADDIMEVFCRHYEDAYKKILKDEKIEVLPYPDK